MMCLRALRVSVVFVDKIFGCDAEYPEPTPEIGFNPHLKRRHPVADVAPKKSVVLLS